jgi:hypothetical protein
MRKSRALTLSWEINRKGRRGMRKGRKEDTSRLTPHTSHLTPDNCHSPTLLFSHSPLLPLSSSPTLRLSLSFLDARRSTLNAFPLPPPQIPVNHPSHHNNRNREQNIQKLPFKFFRFYLLLIEKPDFHLP